MPPPAPPARVLGVLGTTKHPPPPPAHPAGGAAKAAHLPGSRGLNRESKTPALASGAARHAVEHRETCRFIHLPRHSFRAARRRPRAAAPSPAKKQETQQKRHFSLAKRGKNGTIKNIKGGYKYTMCSHYVATKCQLFPIKSSISGKEKRTKNKLNEETKH